MEIHIHEIDKDAKEIYKEFEKLSKVLEVLLTTNKGVLPTMEESLKWNEALNELITILWNYEVMRKFFDDQYEDYKEYSALIRKELDKDET